MTTEEIKRALQCCIGLNGGCDGCPCRHTYYEEDNCRYLMIDAHNAIVNLEKRCNTLNALEQRCKALDETARLMTWEEVLKIAEHNYNAKWDEMENVWLEGHESLIFGFAEPQKMGSYIELFTAGDECGYDCEESEYMKKYRCWTNRPTKDQRTVKWE